MNITSNTSFVINGVPRALAGGFVLNGVSVLTAEDLQLFLMEFDGTATTNATTGVRELVNTGTNGTNATLYGGQGLDGGVEDIYIDTGYIPDLNNDLTIISSGVVGGTPSNPQQHGLYDGSRFHYLLAVNGEIKVGLGSVYETVTHGLAEGDRYVVIISSINSIASIYVNGDLKGSFTHTTPILTSPFFIGARNRKDLGAIDGYILNDYKDMYLIPGYGFTQVDVDKHYQNPERTFYWDNGVAKSDLPSITPAVIADMQAGNGFWYPLCENVNAVDQNNVHYATNACLPRPVNLTETKAWILEAGFTESDNVLTAVNAAVGADASQSHTVSVGDDYVADIDVQSVTGSFYLRLFSGNQGQVDITSNGVYRVLLSDTKSTLLVIALRSVAVDSNIVATINLYNYTNSGLTPINGMTSTAPRTNAEQIEYGLQKPLLTYDVFGVPTGLASIDWQADTNASLVSEALAENNLNVVVTGDPATQIDIYEA